MENHCIARMIVTEDQSKGRVEIKYILTHTNHELNVTECRHLLLPNSVREDIRMPAVRCWSIIVQYVHTNNIWLQVCMSILTYICRGTRKHREKGPMHEFCDKTAVSYTSRLQVQEKVHCRANTS